MAASAENPVRETTRWAAARAKSVAINPAQIGMLARKWRGAKVPAWDAARHYASPDPKRTLDYLIVLDTLNFCFWADDPGKPRWRIGRKGKTRTGYFALSLALKKYFEENPGAGWKEFAAMPFGEFRDMLGGGENLPLLRKRHENLRAVARAMLRRWGGDSAEMVRSAGGKFSELVPLIRSLPSFDDAARYRGRKIWLLKRAQILAADIWLALGGRGLGRFSDSGYLTVFPDYKLPQILRHYGILRYSPRLEAKIRKGKLLPPGSREEVELRSATVAACELLTKELNGLGRRLVPAQVDWMLWNEAKRARLPLPYHKTKTIFY